ncbi:polyprenyl synthetase family protein [Gemella sp. zg-570]|uniref:polyprenyl synthetase family protein n=1 Tax=Gemella sp. zg-570 TaxID=2840371 RepID=UPI001C0DAEFC|nr:farnesyl diphosphate synthase [Gemella sp. zg-570]QWQ38221.1 polyprenyl synthetase family protein [Gemella sp. zg-570]
MKSKVDIFFLDNKKLINDFAKKNISELNTSEYLKQSIEYSLVNEGKKIRPLIFLLLLDYYGIDYKKYLDVALAIELIHTYSLLHDDLPSMDNDDYRWGKLTNHKVFGEDMAVLTGDAMQTWAYELIADNKFLDNDVKIELIRLLSNFSGIKGMIAGQVYDVRQEKYKVNAEYLKNMHRLKTGKLIILPLLFSALVSNNKKDLNLLKEFGNELGIAYQIKDDILDYYGEFENIGKMSSDEDMITYLNFYGIEKCKNLLEQHTEKAKNTAYTLNNNLLIELADLLLNRKK